VKVVLSMLPVAALLVLAVTARDARACAACACGDPTLTALGAEQPFEGRVRMGLSVSQRQEDVPTATGDVAVIDRRTTVGVVWAPSDTQAWSLSVPLVWREATLGQVHETAPGVGGVELRWRWTLWRDRRFAPRWLVALHAGAESPAWFDEGEATLERELWLPVQSTNLLGGLSLLALRGDWSFYLAALGRAPVTGQDAGDAVHAGLTAWVQVQPRPVLALRVGADARWSHDRHGVSHSTARHLHALEPEAPTQSASVLVGPELVVAPAEDWVLTGGLKVPVAHTEGAPEDGLAAILAVTVDL
jgi:hypothetical protein